MPPIEILIVEEADERALETLTEELEFSGYDPSLHHEAGSQSWYFEKAFIAGQHLRSWWFRRKPSSRVSRPTTRSTKV